MERRWKYTRKEEVELFIKKHPGLKLSEIERYFQSKVRGTVRKLLNEGRIYREKSDVYRYYWKG